MLKTALYLRFTNGTVRKSFGKLSVMYLVTSHVASFDVRRCSKVLLSLPGLLHLLAFKIPIKPADHSKYLLKDEKRCKEWLRSTKKRGCVCQMHAGFAQQIQYHPTCFSQKASSRILHFGPSSSPSNFEWDLALLLLLPTWKALMRNRLRRNAEFEGKVANKLNPLSGNPKVVLSCIILNLDSHTTFLSWP